MVFTSRLQSMEKPKDCYSCPFAHDGWPDEWEMHCLFLDRQVGYFGKKLKVPKDCPIVEVPTPHGRLIDADDFFRNFPELLPYEFAAPTIIPAEEGET